MKLHPAPTEAASSTNRSLFPHSEAVLNSKALPLDIPELAKPLNKALREFVGPYMLRDSRSALPLLGGDTTRCGEWPNKRSAAGQCNEFAPFQLLDYLWVTASLELDSNTA